MFSALWVEDEASEVAALAPILLRHRDLALTVAYFGSDADEIQEGRRLRLVRVGANSGVLSYDDAYRALENLYLRFRPWLLIMDLRLRNVESPLAAGGFIIREGRSALVGADMALRLHDKWGVRNMMWLTNYGDAVTMPILKKVTYTPMNGKWRRIGWPRTYVVDKSTVAEDGPPLIEDLINFTLDRLKTGSANNQVRAPQISDLFRKLYGRGRSLKHFFDRGNRSYLDDRSDLLAFDLMPNSDPPLTFGAWLAVFAPNLSLPDEGLLDSDAKVYQATLGTELGNYLWGLPVSQLPGILAHAGSTGAESQGALLIPELEAARVAAGDRVIGPVCRESLIGALQNALRNAERHCPPDKVSIRMTVALDTASLYLLITNPVSDGRAAFGEIVKRAKRNTLSGIDSIRRCVEALANLHPRQRRGDTFGNWGFTLVVCYDGTMSRCEPECPDRGLEVGQDMDGCEAVCARILSSGDTVTAVFRLPFVHPVQDLAFSETSVGQPQVVSS